MPRLWLLLLIVGCAFNPGCLCNGNGHIAQAPFRARAGDDVVNCNCNLTFANDHCSGGTCLAHFAVPFCLPTELQRFDAGTQDAAPLNLDMGPDPYSKSVDQYCRDSITDVIYHMIKVFNGGWCDYKAPFAPNGGIGDSVECFAEILSSDNVNATGLDDGTCRTPCPDVDCDYATNCGGNVQDEDGTIHPERCVCSQVTKYGCPGDPPDSLPTVVFCRPPDGVTIR